jgi:hypothetical protein
MPAPRNQNNDTFRIRRQTIVASFAMLPLLGRCRGKRDGNEIGILVRNDISVLNRSSHGVLVATRNLESDQDEDRGSKIESDCRRFCGDCALKAHGIRAPERAPPAKLSSQLGTESCVVIGNEHHEA